jgi:hypothetical protein
MSTSSYYPYLMLLAVCLSIVATAQAQRAPRIGYIYPAGGQISTTLEVSIGGQGLELPSGVIISGTGIQVEILDHEKPLSNQAVSDIHDLLRELQPKFQEMRAVADAKREDLLKTVRYLLREKKITEKQLRQVDDFERKRNDPKRQQNTQIAETVRVKVTIAENAEPGTHYWRLRTAYGLSNPMRFEVGQHREVREPDANTFDLLRFLKLTPKNDIVPVTASDPVALPVTLNGSVLPGEVDEFSFRAKKNDQVVVTVHARHLVPYLADAVPGWFQAVVSLTNPEGYELAFADDYHFDPDPVLFYKIPYDGEFRINVRDSIYRGREDFVYRITVGVLPFLTGLSPLGGPAGSTVDINFYGGNLGSEIKRRYKVPEKPGMVSLHATNGLWRSNSIPFHIDSVPEETEREPNNSLGAATMVKPPMIVNGRIETRGDADFYRLKGRGNKEMIFEIFARRLGSPLDSSLTVFDLEGNQLGFNDDHEDLVAGLTTHHADSRLSVKLPPDGECFVRVTDTQNQAGLNLAYRLKITQAKPSFALRVTPASLNAKPGSAARLTVHALRVNGFDGPINLTLKGPAGFELKNATVPAGKEVAEVSITVPSAPPELPVALMIQGGAEIEGRVVVEDAVPAEDMMQAFIYRHLVPVDALLIDVRTPPETPKP